MKEYPLDYSPGGHIPTPIADIPFFEGQSPEVIDRMLKNTTILDCNPGDVVIAEGAYENDLLFLLKGHVRIQKDGSIIAATSQSGTLLGEIALLKHGQRTATIIADTHVFCIRVKQDFLMGLDPHARASYYAATYRFLAELLAQRLEVTTEKLAQAEKLLAQHGHI